MFKYSRLLQPQWYLCSRKWPKNGEYAELQFDASRLNQIQVICQTRLGLRVPAHSNIGRKKHVRPRVKVERSPRVRRQSAAWRARALANSSPNINSNPKEFGAKKPRPQILI